MRLMCKFIVQMINFYEWFRRVHGTPDAAAYGEEEDRGPWAIDVAPTFSIPILQRYMTDVFIDAGEDEPEVDDTNNEDNDTTDNTRSSHTVSRKPELKI